MLKSNPQPFPKAELVLGLAAFLALALIFRFSDLDLAISRWAYGASEPHWPGQDKLLWSLLYKLGQLPALTAASIGAFAFVASFLNPDKRGWRGPGLYLALFFLLGPGLLVNELGKNVGGRPRPLEI